MKISEKKVEKKAWSLSKNVRETESMRMYDENDGMRKTKKSKCHFYEYCCGYFMKHLALAAIIRLACKFMENMIGSEKITKNFSILVSNIVIVHCT